MHIHTQTCRHIDTQTHRRADTQTHGHTLILRLSPKLANMKPDVGRLLKAQVRTHKGSPSSLPVSANSLEPSQWNCPCPRESFSEIQKKSFDITVFGKHCECIAQKCTHLERLPPLASHLLLLSHCVLTRHGGKKIKHCSFPPAFEPRSHRLQSKCLAIYANRTAVPNVSYSVTTWIIICLRHHNFFVRTKKFG